MSAVETMDEIIQDVIKDFEQDCVFSYSFEDVDHILTTPAFTITITADADENSDEWEIYAEVNNRAGEKIVRFFDCADTLEDIESGYFKSLFEHFFENNLLNYIPFDDEE